eukprot:TRINITY_DN2223_c0_g1_i1.p3 TRINITY_DN2223_c0_g1~~TRINITY_DN2223_c0_g1_i1.p3  ORF type:complete len:151 (-),score=81.21 TRINITY_DN2223_c0_g1_i1:125-577(-)
MQRTSSFFARAATTSAAAGVSSAHAPRKSAASKAAAARPEDVLSPAETALQPFEWRRVSGGLTRAMLAGSAAGGGVGGPGPSVFESPPTVRADVEVSVFGVDIDDSIRDVRPKPLFQRPSASSSWLSPPSLAAAESSAPAPLTRQVGFDV